ncbi:polyprenyl synthetase family protein [Streptomyces sp. NPDC050704]|uniref:polyprenyl synthetase family protein n=1 Tax=Streptomyces sp. NPDC050704 TaxID=3157219 RepID=UPI0034294A11
MTAEILDCAITAAEGQLGDMRADVDHATRGSVVTAYRGKSGAPFGMITAMAAALAGAEAERIELWREFGCTFGILWQIFNDQEDITSGRNEDLSNGTVTYLFACALEAAPLESRERILDLHADARTSAASRSALTGLLLAPAVLRLYEEDISTFRGEASRSTRTTSVLRPGTTTTLPMADRDRQSTQAPACTARVRYANSCSTLLYRHRVARLTAATPPGAHWR